MDNVTHTIAGLLLTETAVRLRGPTRAPLAPSAHAAAAVAAAIGANLPDADLFYTAWRGEPLAYLLHHRGYSHTVVAAIAGALLLWAATLLAWRRASGDASPGRDARWWLLALLVVAVMSHLALDFTNNYGVHPFWPLDARWYYGDAVFIVEPWLWVVAVPPLLFASRRAAARTGLALVPIAALGLAWTVPMVGRGVALALTLGVAASLALTWRLSPRGRVILGVGGWLLVTATFVAATRAARASIIAAVPAVEHDSSARIVDVVTTPAVSNPFCASAIVVETLGPTYRVRTARVATAPPAVSLAGCGAGPGAGAVRWDDASSAPLAELVALWRENCVARAMLRFVRVPVWSSPSSDSVELADVRYAGRGGGGFAVLRFARRPAVCPSAVPGWRAPREDLGLR